MTPVELMATDLLTRVQMMEATTYPTVRKAWATSAAVVARELSRELLELAKKEVTNG